MGATLSRINEIGPLITSRCAELERARRVPADLLGMLRESGCLRMGTPVSHGGGDAPLPEVLQVIERLSAIDGSLGWLIGQAFIAQIVFRYFPSSVVDEIFADSPDVVGAGAVAPKGKAVRQDGGWRVTGQWPFVSGGPDASWVYLQCVVVSERGEPCFLKNGIPELRLMLFPATETRQLDTWRVLGLRATASLDIRVTRGWCPDERSCGFTATPTDERRLLIHGRDQGGLVIAAVALGIAQGAVDDIASLASDGKRPAFDRQRLAESPLFQDQLGEAQMSLRAARALLYSEAGEAWTRTNMDEQPLSPLQQACLRAVGPAVVSRAAMVTDTAYALAGGSSVFDDSPLQRRLRDIHTATQHFSSGRTFYGSVGALLVGESAGYAML